jgi:hypothetical protein
MGYTVTRPAGTKGAELDTYARLLRQHGKDLGCLPRVPDPNEPGRRWAYAWDTEEEAEHFADLLREQTGDSSWYVAPTQIPPSIGPFGPILIQLARRSDGLAFSVHPLSRAMIHRAISGARPGATSTFIDLETWHDFRKTHGELKDFVDEIVPSLTGLTPANLAELGYAVIDADTDQTWVDVAPSGIVSVHG